MGIFERSEKSRARRCAIVLCNLSRVLRALLRSHDMLPAQARTCLMLQKHWFFYHAVVIPMQCSRSPRARTNSPLTHGQQGSMAKKRRKMAKAAKKGAKKTKRRKKK